MKISHYLLARLVVQKLIDNLVLLCSVNKSNTKASLGFLIEFSKQYFSQYWQVQTRWVFTETVTYVWLHNNFLGTSVLVENRFSTMQFSIEVSPPTPYTLCMVHD